MRIAYACEHKGMYMTMPRLNFSFLQRLALDLLLVVLVALAGAPGMRAAGQAAPAGQQSQQPAAQRSSRTRTTPDAGGPSGDTG